MKPRLIKNDLDKALGKSRDQILADKNEQGFWMGRLSSSAVSTSVAGLALHMHNPDDNADNTEKAGEWLLQNQNADGGWGDTDRSESNYPATILAYSFLKKRNHSADAASLDNALQYIHHNGGLTRIDHYYGDDLTFAVPIKMVMAIAGLIEWKTIPSLPYQTVLLPRKMLRLLRVPVVSYAIPALCAIGMLLDIKNSGNGLRKQLRKKASEKARKLLFQLQPESGGYLEAAPLTGFILTALSELKMFDYPPLIQCAAFLKRTQRNDGSWPIDENLSVWVTLLALSALNASGAEIQSEAFNHTKEWLLWRQTNEHIFTESPSGGFPWTHLSGGVPDADDTGTALTVLPLFGRDQYRDNIENAVRWCKTLQNADGGWPTFCKGWGRLPFDKSSADITAHVLLGLHSATIPPRSRMIQRGLRYLIKQQGSDGSYAALWFGNEQETSKNNYTYASSQVIRALSKYMQHKDVRRSAAKCAEWLVNNQNTDGGWGGKKNLPSTAEETAFAVIGLCAWGELHDEKPCEQAVINGTRWLIREKDNWQARPIGLYFAQLWYYEEAYARIFPHWALADAMRFCKAKRIFD